VTPTASSPSPGVSIQRSARLLGTVNAVVSLACAVLLALGLTQLAQGDVARGIWLLLAALGARWALGVLLGLWSDRASATVRRRWRRTLPQHFLRPRSERARSRGDLALAVDQAADAPSLDLLQTSAGVALVGLAILAWAGGWLALVITIALLAGAVPLYQRAGRRSESMAIDYQTRRALLESRQLELLHHSTELRALGAVAYGANEIAAISDSEHTIAMRAIRVALESSLVTEFLSGVSIGLVAMVVGFALLGGRTSLEHALIAVLVTSEIFLSVRRYGVEFHRRDNAERSLTVLDDVTSPYPANVDTADLLVVLDLVSEARDEPVTFTLHEDERLLVTGPSGSGKTTLVQTFLSWRVPRRGSVARTTRTVGHVSVESSLMSGSLRDNLTLGATIDDEVLKECLSALGLSGPRFEDLDLLLLPDGKGMSSGERVRLVLARCLLAEPALLVLDDIAGVLDADARRLVRSELQRHAGVGIIEATVDTPLLEDPTLRIELHA
jgi:ATP-binding cassette subfamily C protein CydD